MKPVCLLCLFHNISNKAGYAVQGLGLIICGDIYFMIQQLQIHNKQSQIKSLKEVYTLRYNKVILYISVVDCLHV